MLVVLVLLLLVVFEIMKLNSIHMIEWHSRLVVEIVLVGHDLCVVYDRRTDCILSSTTHLTQSVRA